jgi:hypothetical protein
MAENSRVEYNILDRIEEVVDMKSPLVLPFRILAILLLVIVGSLCFSAAARADANPPPTETATLEPSSTVEEMLVEPTQAPPVEIPPTETTNPYPPVDIAVAPLPPAEEPSPAQPSASSFLSGMNRYLIAGVCLVTLVLGLLIVMNVMRKTRK